MRATAVVVNQNSEVLLVKHNDRHCRVDGWQVSDPTRRAVLEVAEETLIATNPKHMGRYAGTVASHEIFLVESQGNLCPNRREIQDASLG